MNKNTLQQKIIDRATVKRNDEYKKLLDFFATNRLAKLLKYKIEDGNLVPFCGHYNNSPLFESGVENKMENADKYTNFNEARKLLLEMFIEEETNDLLNKMDEMSFYFNNETQE